MRQLLKKSQIEATETTTINKDYWVQPLLFFLSRQNQPVCLHNPLTMALFLLGWGKWDRKVWCGLSFGTPNTRHPWKQYIQNKNVEEIKLFLNFSSLRVIHHAKNTRFQ